MNNFLDEYVTSLTSNTRVKIGNLLMSAKADKKMLDRISEKLTTQMLYKNLGVVPSKRSGLIKSSELENNFRNVVQTMQGIYSTSNDISLLINSHTGGLTSEIKRLEDELIELEKLVSNYGFLLGDAQSFDYAFLESFNDETMRENMSSIVPTDRAGQTFSDEEQASVNSNEGILSMSTGPTSSYALQYRVVMSNHDDFITSDTGIEKALNEGSGSGWRRSISSPRPLKGTSRFFSGLRGSDAYSGAQIVIDFTLEESSPCDSISLSPLSDTEFVLSEVRIYKDTDEGSYVSILSDEMVVDKPINLFFPMQSVSKMRAFIRQPSYRRKIVEPDSSEVNYRFLSSHFLDSIVGEINKEPTTNEIYRLGVLLGDFDAFSRSTAVTVPQSGIDTDPTKTSINQLMKSMLEYRQSLFLSNDSLAGRMLVDILMTYTFTDEAGLFGRDTNNAKGKYLLSSQYGRGRANFDQKTKGYHNPIDVTRGINPYGIDQAVPTSGYQNTAGTDAQFMKYHYVFGLRQVSIGTSAKNAKAVFVSKQIPSPGDVGEVKLNVKEAQYNISNTNRDSTLLTSTEYSVSNVSVPTKESDWVPILPADATTTIAERVFPDSSGTSYFRFPAMTDSSINMYKNGYLMPSELVNSFIYSDNKQVFIGVKLASGSYTSNDLLTCDYTPVPGSNLVNFAKAGFDQPALLTAASANGSGEFFDASTGTSGLMVSLIHTPYVDYSQVEDSSYSEESGLNPYTPVVVRFAGGTNAVNLTNYKGGAQSPLDSNAEAIQFVHNGNSILFNRPVSESFHVFYQYMPSNLRFRAVLRSNHTDIVTPKVDFVQVKAKTRRPDARRDV